MGLYAIIGKNVCQRSVSKGRELFTDSTPKDFVFYYNYINIIV